MIATARPAGARRSYVAVNLLLVAVGCKPPDGQDEVDPDIAPPVTGQEDIEQWFSEGHYQGWACEASSHAADMPSPHGRVRLCANPIIHPDSPGEHPLSSAMVIEIRDPTSGAIIGHGAQVHTAAGTRGLDWYWYMKVPLDNATPHDATGLAADGWGYDGPAAEVCTACHTMAGTTGHEGHDFVWVVP